MSDTHPDITRTQMFVADLLDSYQGGRSLLDRGWNAPHSLLTQPIARDNDGSGHTGKPGSRAPCREDLWAHVQTTLDEAHRMCADDLGVYLASDRAEESLRRIPKLLEATLGDCRVCDRCMFDDREQPCSCRHRAVSKRLGQLHSTLRTALTLQEPRQDWNRVECPNCGGRSLSVRINSARLWCRSENCDFVRNTAIGILGMAS